MLSYHAHGPTRHCQNRMASLLRSSMARAWARQSSNRPPRQRLCHTMLSWKASCALQQRKSTVSTNSKICDRPSTSFSSSCRCALVPRVCQRVHRNIKWIQTPCQRLPQARDEQLRVSEEARAAIVDGAASEKAAAASQLAIVKQRNTQERAEQDELLRAAEAAAGDHAQQAQSLRMQLERHNLELQTVKRLARDNEAALQRELSQARQDAEDAATSWTAAAEQLRLQHAESEAALQQHAASAVAAAETRLAERCAALLQPCDCTPLPCPGRGACVDRTLCHVAGTQALVCSSSSGSLGQVLCALPSRRACSTCLRSLMLRRQPFPPCSAASSKFKASMAAQRSACCSTGGSNHMCCLAHDIM